MSEPTAADEPTRPYIIQGGVLRILRSMVASAGRLPDTRTSAQHSTIAHSFVEQGRKLAGETVMCRLLGSVEGAIAKTSR